MDGPSDALSGVHTSSNTPTRASGVTPRIGVGMTHTSQFLPTLIAVALAAVAGIVDDLVLRTELLTVTDVIDAACTGVLTALVTGTLA